MGMFYCSVLLTLADADPVLIGGTLGAAGLTALGSAIVYGARTISKLADRVMFHNDQISRRIVKATGHLAATSENQAAAAAYGRLVVQTAASMVRECAQCAAGPEGAEKIVSEIKAAARDIGIDEETRRARAAQAMQESDPQRS